MTKLRRVLACLGYVTVQLVAGDAIERARHTREWRRLWERQGIEIK